MRRLQERVKAKAKGNPPPPGIEPETFRLQDSYEELLTAERATNCATEDLLLMTSIAEP